MNANTSEVQLFCPVSPFSDETQPLVSIVVPALNEQITIEEFVKWCRQGLADAGVPGEILIVDSSTDRTAELAVAQGARVLKVPKRGLGRAYIDALPYVRGKYLILGDCDCTYDFREIRPFVDQFNRGFEFIMGSRFRGYIEPGAMPPLHRYLGTPVTTWILNLIYSSRFSDIHCGMRGITRNAFEQMNLKSQSWEYASEMVIKSVHMELKTTEVPIRFLQDRGGRVSHHKREGWFSPWKAAWINLRAMFIYGADFFLFRPGILLTLLGLSIVLPLSFGPITLGGIQFSLYWMLLGVSLAILGLQCFYMGIIFETYFDFKGNRSSRWLKIFEYNRSVLGSGMVFLVGFVFCSFLVKDYVDQNFTILLSLQPNSYLAVLGLLLMITAFMNFTFTLSLHAAALACKPQKYSNQIE